MIKQICRNDTVFLILTRVLYGISASLASLSWENFLCFLNFLIFTDNILLNFKSIYSAILPVIYTILFLTNIILPPSTIRMATKYQSLKNMLSEGDQIR